MELGQSGFAILFDILPLSEDQKVILTQREEDFISNNYLDLSDLGLTAIPETIFEQFAEIQHLNLSNNALEDIPPELFYPLYQLMSLDMSACISPTNLEEGEILSLPEKLFERQINLILLDLSGNQLEYLPDGFFDNLYNLEALNLSHNMLALLPMSIGNCINLEELYLEANFLPIEFKEVYADYLDVQDFLAPFSQAWQVMNNPLDMLNEYTFDEEEKVEIKTDIADQLKDAFSLDT
ncbi:MAG: leucine-rich repeat protein [Candidatus Heimdallarchaeota archaeon]|nr:leucine-rich repeat protein [Candidatus Heimdallarchaeota archaeon]